MLSLAVTLTISVSDASGVPQMCVSNTQDCTAWEAFVAAKAWTLVTGANGLSAVYVILRYGAGNTALVGASTSLSVPPPLAPRPGVKSLI